jgi:hypothetical protein
MKPLRKQPIVCQIGNVTYQVVEVSAQSKHGRTPPAFLPKKGGERAKKHHLLVD